MTTLVLLYHGNVLGSFIDGYFDYLPLPALEADLKRTLVNAIASDRGDYRSTRTWSHQSRRKLSPPGATCCICEHSAMEEISRLSLSSLVTEIRERKSRAVLSFTVRTDEEVGIAVEDILRVQREAWMPSEPSLHLSDDPWRKRISL
jgi:hypothetical protein